MAVHKIRRMADRRQSELRVKTRDAGRFAVMLGSAATAADIDALRTRLGLDASLPVQYVQFLDSVIQLRLGDSIFLGRSVMQALAERAPLTLQLTVLAAGLATLIGVPIGVLSARRASGIEPVEALRYE